MKQRVLHVIDHTSSGGAQVVVQYLVQALQDRFSFAVAVLGASGQFSQAYAALGVPVFELGNGYNRWNPFPAFGLVETIRHEAYDLIHTHLFKSHILGTIAARWTGRKTILHDHSDIYLHSLKQQPYLTNTFIRSSYLAVYRYALRYCDRAIVLAPETLHSYIRFYSVDPSKVTVLPNAVDVHRFFQRDGHLRDGSIRIELGLSVEARVVLMAGRLELEKDWRTFLGVARQVQQISNHPCAFLIAGSGSEERTLRDYAQDQKLDNVFFLGYRNDVATLLSQADVFLLTSRREAFPIVVLEAMAAGCPVVATRSSGPESIVTDGVDGLLAEVGDVPGLTNHVMRLLHDNGLSHKLTTNARQTVTQQYSLDAVAARMAEIYTEVLGL